MVSRTTRLGGLLIELNPELCSLLEDHRPNSRTIKAALGSPDQVGEFKVSLAEVCGHTTLEPIGDKQQPGSTRTVQVRTLDSILAESGLARIDFLSIDVEGMELNVMRGFDLCKRHPQLILIEDEFENYSKHEHLVACGYKLVRRTSYNNWYVPKDAPVTVRSISTTKQMMRLYRKMWLGPLTAIWKKAKEKF